MHKFKGDVQVEGTLVLPNLDTEAVLTTDASGNVVGSDVTATELSRLEGVTSNIQDQLDSKVDAGDLGDFLKKDGSIAITGDLKSADNVRLMISNFDSTGWLEITDDGYGSLAATNAKVQSFGNPVSLQGTEVNVNMTKIVDLADPTNPLDAANKQYVDNAISALPDPIVYGGTWDASTNTPTLNNSDTGQIGKLYRVTVAGVVDFGDGNISFDIGDSVVNNGTIWEKWDHSDQVNSVNGQTGNVVLDSDDIAEGTTNLYFTDQRAQDAVLDLAAANGELLIGNGTGLELSTLTAGAGITITNGAGTITIASESGGSDIPETLFNGAQGQASPAAVTGLAFDSSIRAFKALIAVEVDAATGLYEFFTLDGLKKNADWSVDVSSVGDTSLITFDIDATGQITYTSGSYGGFISLVMKFRAMVLTV